MYCLSSTLLGIQTARGQAELFLWYVMYACTCIFMYICVA